MQTYRLLMAYLIWFYTFTINVSYRLNHSSDRFKEISDRVPLTERNKCLPTVVVGGERWENKVSRFVITTACGKANSVLYTFHKISRLLLFCNVFQVQTTRLRHSYRVERPQIKCGRMVLWITTHMPHYHYMAITSNVMIPLGVPNALICWYNSLFRVEE